MLSLHLAVLSLVGLGITVRRRHLVAVFAPHGYFINAVLGLAAVPCRHGSRISNPLSSGAAHPDKIFPCKK